MHDITSSFDVIKVDESGFFETKVQVCIENTYSLLVNGELIVRLSLSPTDLIAYAAGYLICEGLIDNYSQIEKIDIIDDKILVIAPTVETESLTQRMEIFSSGYPGKLGGWKSLNIPIHSTKKVTKEAIFRAAKNVNALAEIWIKTGGTHGSLIADKDGELISYAEDMGRHTSIDKAVGKAVIMGTNLEDCIIACSGRMPADMVAKCYRAGFSIIISHNAPFTEGINLAKKLNLTLIGFARPPRMIIYSGFDRVILK